MPINAPSNRAVIVIPSRYGSSRFPGKPLAVIAGKSMLQRVWGLARQAPSAKRVVIATDDARIEKHAKEFGAEVVMTSETCRNGSERVLEALNKLKDDSDIVINLQGDAPIVPPWVVEEIIQALVTDLTAEVATPAVQLSNDQLKKTNSNNSLVAGGTTVTFDRSFKALYFSKSQIPFVRSSPKGAMSPVYRHIGLYGYRRHTLEKYVGLEPGFFEEVEQLEQLRLLEHGISVRVCVTDLKGRTLASVDNPDDLKSVEEIILKEGELVA